MGIFMRRIMGCIALTMGLAITGWFIYNQFSPTPEFQRSYLGIFQLAVPIAFLIVGWRWLRYQGPGIEETRPDLSCPELAESVQHAKQAMPYFLEQVRKNIDNAFVKFPMKTERGLTEHIWAYVHSYQEGKFNVSLANKPIDPSESQLGRRDVLIEDVEDWQIMERDGRIRGAFSLIALFRYRENRGCRLSPKMRKQKEQLIDTQQPGSTRLPPKPVA